MFELGLHECLIVYFAGALGALVRQLVDDNKIVFPAKVTGGMALGFLGSMVIGGFVGLVIDGSFVTAAMAGYVGSSMLERVLPEYKKEDCN